ncbi:hypothetical protein GOP47_0024108 [Adiantum capillus-veneris]|uniref:Cell division cycle protein 123 homolog n=1 Tax=Adiantum capillus-veneris TaxID=13818 RepID=A0A9D4U507_ADICA|nr:hypothetical protein GOP47_0024108 [Adiantum capillus-veneris]
MKARDLELCQIQHWFPRFKSLSLKTIILPLPESFISYLEEDGLFLPRNSEALPARAKGSCEDGDYRHWAEEDDEADEPNPPSFPELEAEVAESIAKLDGFVFPKLNWSAPKDSAWISSHGNLKCTNFGEICLLLKASDSLVHDLSHAFDSCDDKMSHRPQQFFLALRKWYDMRPEMEFRGFVKRGLLVGVSQREVTGFYPALLESRETLDASIFQFFVDCLSECFELDDYTFDCYVTRTGKVKLVDFNPWGAFTLPLLFTWDELEGTYARFEGVFARSTDADRLLFSESCNVSFLSKDVNGAGDQEKAASHCLDSNGIFHFNGEETIDTDTAGNNGAASSNKKHQSNNDEDVAHVVVADKVDNLACSTKDSVMAHPELAASHTGSRVDRIGGVLDSIERKPASSNLSQCWFPAIGRKEANTLLRERGFKSELRIVQSDCHVQVNLRVGGGVPYDYVLTGPGSAWDEFLRRAGEELQQQHKDAAAGG